MQISTSLQRTGPSFTQIADRARPGIEQSVADTTVDYRDTARRNAPVDTGYLRDHIVIVDEGPLAQTVESQADYSEDVEFGTAHQAAQPYMLPARDEVAGRFEDRMEDALNAAAGV